LACCQTNKSQWVPGEIVTAGQVVKAIILNGLGFVSRSLYLFPQFFEDKATEHLRGDGIEPKHLNDDKISRVMDKLYQLDVSAIFLLISLAAVKKFGVATENSHLDATSLSVEGEYNTKSVEYRLHIRTGTHAIGKRKKGE
jgi:transposase